MEVPNEFTRPQKCPATLSASLARVLNRNGRNVTGDTVGHCLRTLQAFGISAQLNESVIKLILQPYIGTSFVDFAALDVALALVALDGVFRVSSTLNRSLWDSVTIHGGRCFWIHAARYLNVVITRTKFGIRRLWLRDEDYLRLLRRLGIFPQVVQPYLLRGLSFRVRFSNVLRNYVLTDARDIVVPRPIARSNLEQFEKTLLSEVYSCESHSLHDLEVLPPQSQPAATESGHAGEC